MISVRFDNLDQLRDVYDPAVVDKAAKHTIKQLQSKSATKISEAIRGKYKIKAREIKSALNPVSRTQDGIHSGFLIYTSKRISLRHFAGGAPNRTNRPRVKTKRGARRGARATPLKGARGKIIDKAFWGHGSAGRSIGEGSMQIFQRIGSGRLKIRKLTGPSISHMVRGEAPMKAINDHIQNNATRLLEHNLDHFIKRRAGIR